VNVNPKRVKNRDNVPKGGEADGVALTGSGNRDGDKDRNEDGDEDVDGEQDAEGDEMIGKSL
jgi:hypothetical protein